MIKNGNKYTFTSFYDWCIQNKLYDLISRWDYEKNDKLPQEISMSSKQNFYLKCPNGIHGSRLFKPIDVRENRNINQKCLQCNSFAQWGIDNLGGDFLQKYWDYERNENIDPWIIQKSCKNKVWIKCQDVSYHESYQIRCYEFLRGNRCSYCGNKKVHPKDSFAQYHIDYTDKDFISKYWGKRNVINPFSIKPYSKRKVYIKCQTKEYHGEYEIECSNFMIGQRCSYCGTYKVHKLDSIANEHPQSLELWSDKNKKSPYEYSSGSTQTIYWKCENGIHEDYKRYIYTTIICGFRCPECVRERDKSFLQEKVEKHLNNKYKYKVKHEHQCSIVPQNPRINNERGKMPFDNEIVDLKLIIEVHGRQHYIPNTKTSYFQDKSITPEQQLKQRKIYDRYKRIVAHLNNYYYLEIPYWTEKDESYKNLIDNKIQEIINKKVG